jgi:chemotaxis protein histidine kinase CheA
MPADQFEARLAKVRHRFAGSLESKIKDTFAAVAEMSNDAPDAHVSVDESYRRMHTICGVAPAVGFVTTGRVAREAEVVLLVPMRAKRALTAGESALFKKALDALWKAAQGELQMMYGRGG